MRLTILTCVLAFCAVFAADVRAQLDPPTATCVEVLADGTAIVNWLPPADPGGEFTSYDIVYSTDYFTADTGTQLFSEPTYAVTSYTDMAVDFNNDIGAYYLETNSNDGTAQVSVPSDTICGIHLTLNVLGGGGIANLFWNAPMVNTAAVTGDYEVWLEFPAGTWNQVATVPHNPDNFNQNYQYIVDDCAATYGFQIFYTSPSGCQFISNVATDDFEDLTSPDIPEVDVVTIDHVTNQYQVNWFPSTASDTQGYIIYECISGANVPVDTVYGAGTTSWNHGPIGVEPAPIPGTTVPANFYTVAAFDFCDFGNVSPTEPQCSQPPYLLDIVWTQCTDFAELLWTPYSGRTVDTYTVYVSEDGGPFNVLSVLPGTQLTFTHENLQDGVTYQYYIEAGFTTTVSVSCSNKRAQAISLAPPPAFTYLASVDVRSAEEVEVRIHTENIFTDHLYILERRKVGGQFWVNVDNQLSSGANAVIFNDFDPDLNLGELEYDYRTHVLNTCGDTATTTNIGRTLLLEGLANNERLVNTLAWPDYQEWDGNIVGFDIYRSQMEGVLGDLIVSLPAGANVYEDDIADLLTTPGLFCYTVVAREDVNSFGIQEVASSNQLCLQMEPKIWIPNAFMVFGNNPVFKPVIGFVDANSYEMVISSRWGDILFTTNDLEGGWDGTGRRGDYLPDGAYVYFVTVKDGQGQQYDRVGQVFLLKAGPE